MAGISPGMYPGSYPSSEQNPYPSIAMENSASAFYGSLVSRDQCLELSRMGWDASSLNVCIHCSACLLALSNLFIEFILAIKVASDISVWAGRDPGIRGNKAVKSVECTDTVN